jgi:hypothetical protein
VTQLSRKSSVGLLPSHEPLFCDCHFGPTGNLWSTSSYIVIMGFHRGASTRGLSPFPSSPVVGLRRELVRSWVRGAHACGLMYNNVFRMALKGLDCRIGRSPSSVISKQRRPSYRDGSSGGTRGISAPQSLSVRGEVQRFPARQEMHQIGRSSRFLSLGRPRRRSQVLCTLGEVIRRSRAGHSCSRRTVQAGVDAGVAGCVWRKSVKAKTWPSPD